MRACRILVLLWVAARVLVFLFGAGKFREVRLQLFHGFLRGFLAQGEARSLRFARYFRQGLQHALSKRRVVVVQQAFQIIGGQIFVVDRNHSLGQGVGVEVFLEAGSEGVGKLFGGRIIGLRILEPSPELSHSAL